MFTLRLGNISAAAAPNWDFSGGSLCTAGLRQTDMLVHYTPSNIDYIPFVTSTLCCLFLSCIVLFCFFCFWGWWFTFLGSAAPFATDIPDGDNAPKEQVGQKKSMVRAESPLVLLFWLILNWIINFIGSKNSHAHFLFLFISLCEAHADIPALLCRNRTVGRNMLLCSLHCFQGVLETEKPKPI